MSVSGLMFQGLWVYENTTPCRMTGVNVHSGLGLRVWGFTFRISGFGFWFSSFEFRVSSLEPGDWGWTSKRPELASLSRSETEETISGNLKVTQASTTFHRDSIAV